MLFRKRYPLFDENNGGQGSAGGGGQGSQGGGQGGQGGKPENPLLSMPIELVPEEWRDHVRDLRKENKSLRERGHQHQEELAATHAEAKRLADKAISDAQAAADAKVIRAEMRAAAIKAGIVDLDGLALADMSNVKFDAKGELQGAQEALDALKKAKPYLFTTTTSNTGHQGQQGQQGAKGKDGKDAMAMTDAEWQAQKKAMGLR